MVKNEISIMIHRPIDEVFTYVSNIENGPQWQTGLFEVRSLTPGPLGVGSKFAAVRKFLGQKIEGVVEIIVYEPNSKMVIKSLPGTMPFEESYLFNSTTEGTRLFDVLELHPSGLLSLAEPMIAGSLKREMEAALGDLKDLLEQPVNVVSA